MFHDPIRRGCVPLHFTGADDMHKTDMHAGPQRGFSLRRTHTAEPSTTRRAGRSLVLFAAVLLALSGCGGGADPTPSDRETIQPVNCAASAGACT
jgi:hypothetical protein